MTTIVNREIAKEAIFDLADLHACRIECYSLLPDSFRAVCRASRATYWKLVSAMIDIGLETSLQHVERRDGDVRQWDLVVRVPDRWTLDRIGETATSAHS